MKSSISVLSTAALIASTYCAPAPAPNAAPGLALLRRALKSARSPLPQTEVPFDLDEAFCFWKPDGDCLLNGFAAEIYDYLKIDPPEHEYDDYDETEGIYASDQDAYDAYLVVLSGLYVLINDHTGYQGYDYDYDAYQADHEDDYLCVWTDGGDCWFNDAVKYVDDIWDVPYKKSRSVRRADDLSVYATSDGIQDDYAGFVFEVYSAINANGPVDLDIGS